MARPYSLDLRERVVASVEGGQSRRKAARQFAVSIASVCEVDAAQAADREPGGEADGAAESAPDPGG